MADATQLAEVLQEHAPYVRTEGGIGCIADDTTCPTWDVFAGHLARAFMRKHPESETDDIEETE